MISWLAIKRGLALARLLAGFDFVFFIFDDQTERQIYAGVRLCGAQRVQCKGQAASVENQKSYVLEQFSTRHRLIGKIKCKKDYTLRHKFVMDLSQMIVSLDQAIEIHAKVLIYRAGASARKRAKDAALSCKSRGDNGGHEVWTKVASTIDELNRKPSMDSRSRN